MRKKYTLNDLRYEELDLMKKACYLQEGYFLCFGKYFNKLYQLGLIDDENQVTRYGYQVMRDVLQRAE